MADSTNRVHVSPGVYTSETVDMKAAANSLGVTKLAVVGETLKGPAFQPYWINSPREFASVFGGTSTKKFAGSNYPKYELPYIANEYLSKSNELCVVRTLGFSGYNAGPAWVITGTKSSNGVNGKKYVIGVLRSRGTYKYRAEYANFSDGGCSCQSAYDSLTFDVGEIGNVPSCSAPKKYNMNAVTLSQYYSINSDGTQCTNYALDGTAVGYSASYGDLGRFTINCVVGVANDGDLPGSEATSGATVSIPVSLNKSDKDYIIKVLGTSNDDGDQPLYVESLYDVAWEDLVINEGFDTVSSGLTTYNVGFPADYCGLDAISGILVKHEAELSKKDLGKRFLYATNITNGSPADVKYYVHSYATNTVIKYAPAANGVFSDTEAANSTANVETREYFQITDGNKAGIYANADGETHTVKELYSQIGLDSQTYKVIKINTNDLDYCVSGTCVEGEIYTVGQIIDSTGKRHYVYKAYDKSETDTIVDKDEKVSAEDRLRPEFDTSDIYKKGSIVYNYEDGLYYKNIGEPQELERIDFDNRSGLTPQESGNMVVIGANDEFALMYSGSTITKNTDGTWPVESGKKYLVISGENGSYTGIIYKSENNKTIHYDIVAPVECDINNYKSSYRYSSTPWVVSNAKGDANHIELNKLFRFHTISDGKNSVDEVKVSIENIRPDQGQFDVVVRSYYDNDSTPLVLERYSKCTMAHGKKFIGYMIGTIDGQYESKSKYITVEVAESTAATNSVPAGFLGYSIPKYDGATISDGAHDFVSIAPIKYNTNYSEDISKKKQYFGISDRTGYDYDYFSFKGNMSTLEDPDFMSHGFHLDCRLDANSYGTANAPILTVDGVDGYVFDTVSVNARTSSLQNSPIIATERDMEGSIYEDVKTRKFTLVFAGGFDGWDEYRDQRTNTDEFAYSTYKGYINKTNGIGYAFDMFDTFNDRNSYNIEGNSITSDYYSTLAGVSLLKNPEEVDINLLATPGIDTLNNTKLVNEVFNILEDRADTFYIVTTPDKNIGSSDYTEDIPDVEDTVSDFMDTELHSDYAATYYPWVKIDVNGEYMWLPATKDVVRNMAESDNTNTTMNLAPAGITRGKVNAVRARKNLKLAECDNLYEANINPVRTYAQEGVVIMGQKTLRESDDLLNRIDVRRCVLRMRKLIAIGTLGLIFEPNDSSTVQSFKSIVNGIMEGFVKNRAISNWKMDVDESEEARDRLEIPATIYIKPIRALEYISINFVVTNNGAYFED